MMLEPLTGLRVVDLFAGSGALGIEALSRGASWVDFVEAEVAARRALEQNLADLGATGRARIWPLRLPRGLRSLSAALGAADLVLADPPYGGDEERAVLEALGGDAIPVGARVVVEHHAKDEVPERAGRLQRARERRYGETTVSIYRVEPEAEPSRQEER